MFDPHDHGKGHDFVPDSQRFGGIPPTEILSKDIVKGRNSRDFDHDRSETKCNMR